MSKRQYSGEPLDVSWQTPPWQNNGETLDAYDSEGDGEIMTIDWPENATDPDELNDKQKKMILTAVNYPDVDSPTQLVELSGLDVSKAYPQNVLSTHWPDRYWVADNSEIDVDELRQRLLDGGSLNKLVKEYPASQKHLSRLARGEADDMPDCDIPPLTYPHNSEQKWVVDESKEADENTPGVVDVTTEELRRRALNGEHATDIAESLGVSDAPIRKRLRGYDGYGADSDIPPLEFDRPTEEWYIADGEEESEKMESDVPESVTAETHQRSVPAWVWVVFGAFAMWVMSKLRE